MVKLGVPAFGLCPVRIEFRKRSSRAAVQHCALQAKIAKLL